MKIPGKLLRNGVLILLFFTAQSAHSQCVKSFPYTEDFEKFTLIQNTEACNASILGDTANGWMQEQTDNGEWRADTAGTPSIGTGPGATDTSNGVGVGTDYNPGKTGGHYLYTEATSSTGCAKAEVNLISPCFDLSGSAYYRIKLAYHMFGAGMGSLHIDVYDSNVWVKDVWKVSGDQGMSWNVATVSLANFRKSGTRIRIRAVMGANYLSDCAIDDFKIESFTPYDVDLVTLEVRNSIAGYQLIPFKQADSVRFWGKVKNEGVKSALNTRLVVQNGSWSDSLSFGTLGGLRQDSGYIPTKILPKPGMSNSFLFAVKTTSTDGNPSNDTLRMQTQYNDTIYSRDDGSSAGGLGFNGATGGRIGQMYELLRDDTLTSVSFYITNPVAGDSVKVHLYEFGTTPGNLIATTKHVKLLNGVNWYTLRFPCEQFLKKGKYFAAVEQLNLNNMSLGYSNKFYVPNSAYYNGGASWVELGGAGFEVVIMVRLNLGKLRFPDIRIDGPDTSCSGKPITLNAKGANTWLWSSGGVIRDSTKATVQVTPQKSFNISLRGTNLCGLSSVLTKTMTIERTPSGKISADTTACIGDVIKLRASGGSGYQWVGGPANQDWNYLVKGSELVAVLIDTSNGCTRRLTTNITASSSSVAATKDTTVCAGSVLQLVASGANSYQWENGPATAKWNVRPGTNTSYVVWGYNTLGCRVSDTVKVQTRTGPSVQMSSDTAVCFGDRVLLKMEGGTSWQWKNGPAAQTWNVLPIFAGYYYGTAKGSGTCGTTDSIYVQVERRPVINLRSDTTICEGSELELEAESPDEPTYLWSTGATTKQIRVSPSSSTKYKVDAFNSIGCSTSDSVQISVNPLPRASFTYALKARDITLSNKSMHATNHSWDFGDGESSNDQNPFHRYKVDGNYQVKLTVTNGCGSDDTTVTVEVLNLSVSDAVLKGVNVFPIPAKDLVHVTWDVSETELHQVQLRDLNGRSLLVRRYSNQESPGSVQLDLGQLSEGIYQLELSGTNGTGVVKIVIAR